MPKIQNRRATAAQWAAANPVLAAGELGFELDTNKTKVGDGLTPWSGLSYFIDEDEILAVGNATYGTKAEVAQVESDLDAAKVAKSEAAASLAAASALAPATRTKPPAPQRIVTTFEPGHTWTIGNGGTDSTTASTDRPLMGSQAAKLVGQTGGQSMHLTGYQTPDGPVIDMTGKAFLVWLRVDDVSRLGGIMLRAGSNVSTNFFEFRVSGGNSPMSINPGGPDWLPFMVPWAPVQTVGTPDRTMVNGIQLFVTQNGPGPGVVVHVGGIAIVDDQTRYPNGVLSICFDDGADTQYTVARPILARHGIRPTLFLIKDVIDTSGFITSGQVHELQDALGWEMAGHAYALATHNLPESFTQLTDAQLDLELKRLKEWSLRNGHRGADLLAYPKGKVPNEQVVARYYSQAFTTDHYIPLTVPPARPMRMARKNVAATDTPASLVAMAEKARADKTWLILNFHKIVESGATGDIEYTRANFESVVTQLAALDMPILPVGEVLAS